MTDPAQPTAPAPAPTGENPGRGLGIAALVFAFFFAVVGLILGFVAKRQSAAAGHPNGPAAAAIAVSIVVIVLWLAGAVVALTFGATAFEALEAKCAELGPGIHEVDGTTYTCS